MSLTDIFDYSIAEYSSLRTFLKETFPKPKIDNKKTILAPLLSSSPALIGTAFDYLLRFHLKKEYKRKVHSRRWASEVAIKLYFRPDRPIEIRSTRESDGMSDDEFYAWVREKQKLHLIANRKAPLKFKRSKRIYNKFICSKLKNYDQLVDSCLFLARLDDVYRRGPYMKEFLSVSSERKEDINELKLLMKNCDLTIFRPKTKLILNPTFGVGSQLVGGADADFIVDGTLIDIKVTKHLQLSRPHFNQLIGYYLLFLIGGVTEHPEVRITRLGIYFARHGFLWSIDIASLGNEKEFAKAVKALKQTMKKNAVR